ncbi:MAG: MBL fold metallo-hydrolase [Syntrophomonas sp.]
MYIDDDIKAVIDSSCGDENLGYLFEHPPEVILNSHFHEDHILNNHLFPRAQVWLHAQDAPAARSLEVFQEFYGFQQFDGRQLGRKFIKSVDLQASPVHREITDGEILDFGSVHLQVVHLPGHTPGHCGFYEEKSGLLFSGDIDLSGFGPWYAHLCSDLDYFMKSIQKCIEINPRLIVSSHKGIIREDIVTRLKKYHEIIFTKEQQVLNALQQPANIEQLASRQIFYGPHVKLGPFMFWMEKMAVYKHLERLIKLNQIEQSGETYYLK